jgi:hypothetical protein
MLTRMSADAPPDSTHQGGGGHPTVESVGARLAALGTPGWRTAEHQKDSYAPHNFATYQAHRLRTSWSEIDMNLRSVFDHYADQGWFDLYSANEAVAILETSREALEQESPHVDDLEADLGRARRLLIWLVPTQWLMAQTDAIEAHLRNSKDPEAMAIKLDRRAADLRFQLDNAIGVLNDIEAAMSLNSGLQRRRLERFAIWAGAGLLAAILLAPELIKRSSLDAWGFMPFDRPELLGWATTIAVALFGAIGALVSAILQVGDKPVTYTDYQVRGVEVAVRAGVGAILAIVAYVLLSYDVLPGMSMKNPGTYFLAALGAGFSQRWILGLLGVEKDVSGRSRGPATPNPAPPPMESAKDMARQARKPS